MYDTYRTTYTVRPRLGSVERKGTPITEEQFAELWKAEAASHQPRKSDRAATEEHKARVSKAKNTDMGSANAARSEARRAREEAVLGLLRDGPKSGQEIARLTGAGLSSVTRMVQSLRGRGFGIIRVRDGNAATFQLEAGQ